MTQKTVWDKIDKSLIVVHAADAEQVPAGTRDDASSQRSWPKTVRRAARDAIASVVWLYIFFQLFVVDVDTTIITPLIPGSASYLRYKLLVPLFLLVIVALLWRSFWFPRSTLCFSHLSFCFGSYLEPCFDTDEAPLCFVRRI
jgi:hypothetical protein